MNYVDSWGAPVSKAQIDRERDYFIADKRKLTIPVTMTFTAYVAKYLGWKIKTVEKQ